MALQVMDTERAESRLLHVHRRIRMHARLKQFPPDQFIDEAGLPCARLSYQRDMDLFLQLPLLLFPFRLHFLFQIHAEPSLSIPFLHISGYGKKMQGKAEIEI